MTTYTSYVLILLGGAAGWAVSLVVPGFSPGVGIAVGVAMGISVAADRHGETTGCRLLGRSQGRGPQQR